MWTLAFLVVCFLARLGRIEDQLAVVEEIPHSTGMFFVPQFWFSLSNENWQILYNIPLVQLDARIKLIDATWRQIQKGKADRKWVHLSEPRLELLQHSWVEFHGLYEQ